MDKLEQAFTFFDNYNKQSPEHITWKGEEFPSEYFYALKLYDWVNKLEPDAPEALLLASRSQHIGRWEIARKSYPDGRVGYLKWRSDLAKFHAQKSSELLLEAGFDETIINRVKQIILKQRIKADNDVQTIENALCLVFLEFQFDDLIQKLSEEKMIDILQKTWAKMSTPGQDAALAMQYSEEGSTLLKKALNAG
ncbi:DUF4202 domain-containing protein [Dyadobacter frigoris]|uniref:DUF4202 domain-containing protein n=1 Tax=Dyadobacter frigoris TaxID=2576211 RepID=A0A4U6D7Y4_9BACT|nr:DUF4202 domain-containing protein [Dyadobacter frigoris]TKT90234.1 DUF4202 domain-containing protein [Dyadobacter frigoris]GLU52470.1 hypothetical protein Dfri01_19310 [Dyadobacter frigoris]